MADQLTARFSQLQEESPNHSSYIVFMRLMREQRTTNQRVVSLYFNKLVEKGDYEPRDKKKLLKVSLVSLQNKGFLAAKVTKTAQVEIRRTTLPLRPLFA